MRETIRFGQLGEGSLTRAHEGATWYSVINYKGRQFEWSTRTTDLKAAKKFHKQKLDGLAVDRQGKGELVTPAHERLLFAALLEDLERSYTTRQLKSWRTTRSHLVPLKAYFKGWRAVDVTFRAVERYTAQRQKAGLKNATINRELELLRRALKLGHDHQLLLTVPKVEMLAEHNTRTGFFERATLEAVVAALPEYLKDFTRFAYVTGMRLNEVRSIRWADVDRAVGALQLRSENAKTGEGRTVMLAGDTAELIERRWHDRPFTRVTGRPFVSELVFHRQGKPIGDFRRSWKTACRAAGVPERTFHDLRRSAVRNMDRAGVSRHVAMRITGHKSESTYQRYNIVSEADLRLAAQKNQFYLDTLPVKRDVQ
jgi:integrase